MNTILPIIATFLLIIGYAYDNRIRGSSDKPWFIPGKWAAYAWFTILLNLCVWLVYGQELFETFKVPFSDYQLPMWQGLLIDFPITWLCFAFGWGDYFPHGRRDLIDMSIKRKKEFYPAEVIANAIHGRVHEARESKWLKKWQTTAMSFRFGLTFSVLKFPWLAIVFGNWIIAAAGSLMFLAGPIYRVAFIKHDENSVPKAEYMIGALLGILTSVLFWRKKK